jgi:hypothetical protein
MSQKDLLAKINDDPMRIEQARCETFGIWRGQRLRDLEVVDAKKMANESRHNGNRLLATPGR